MKIQLVRKGYGGRIISLTKALEVDEAIAELLAMAAKDDCTIDESDGAIDVIDKDGKVLDTWYVQ